MLKDASSLNGIHGKVWAWYEHQSSMFLFLGCINVCAVLTSRVLCGCWNLWYGRSVCVQKLLRCNCTPCLVVIFLRNVSFKKSVFNLVQLYILWFLLLNVSIAFLKFILFTFQIFHVSYQMFSVPVCISQRKISRRILHFVWC